MTTPQRLLFAAFLLAATSPAPVWAQDDWNTPRPPFRIFGDTWYVGIEGLSAVLLASPEGHVLLDGALPESGPLIMDNIRALGFRVEDVELIVNSHAHFDHAGGIAAIQRASGARVAASPPSAAVLARGASGPDDPQYGIVSGFPPVSRVETIADGDTLRVGRLALVARFTPGHTPGGTTWTWRACEGERCLDFVYADSQNPVSADGFLFTRSTTYPSAMADFRRGRAVLEGLECDVLLTPHPDASGMWDRVTGSGRNTDALPDPGACRRYAETARARLERRIDLERSGG